MIALVIEWSIKGLWYFCAPIYCVSDARNIARGCRVQKKQSQRCPLGQGQLMAFRPLFRRYFDGG